MHILQLVLKVPYPPKDGGAVATLNMTEGLQQQGNQVTILAFNTKKHYVTAVKYAPLQQIADVHTVDLDSGVSASKAFLSLFFSRYPYPIQRFVSADFSRKLEVLLQTKLFDVIQLESQYFYPYISIIRKYSQAQIAIRMHNLEYELWQQRAENEPFFLKKRYFRLLARQMKKYEKRQVNRCDLVVAISAKDKAKARQQGNRKPSIVIPSGIRVGDRNERKIGRNFNLMYLAALDWLPNQEGLSWFITHCWSIIQQKIPAAELHIAGRNAPANMERSLPDENVFFYGEVDSAHAFLAKGNIVLVPLLQGGGMRVKIIEAMALAKAVIATPKAASGIDGENDKHWLIAQSAEEFANKTIELLNDFDKVQAIGQEAKSFVTEKFDNFAWTQKLHLFYRQYLKK